MRWACSAAASCCRRRPASAPAGWARPSGTRPPWTAPWRCSRELGFHGISQVEYKRDPRDGTLRLMEVNARLWQWHSLAAACGVTLVDDGLPRRARTARRRRRPARGAGRRRWVALVRHLRESRRERLSLRATLGRCGRPFRSRCSRCATRCPAVHQVYGALRSGGCRDGHRRRAAAVAGKARWATRHAACGRAPRPVRTLVGAARSTPPARSTEAARPFLAAAACRVRRRRRGSPPAPSGTCPGGRSGRVRPRPPRPVRRRVLGGRSRAAGRSTRCCAGSRRPAGRQRRPGFRVVLTHDIDTPWHWTAAPRCGPRRGA